jgi:hypothetical protein
LVDIKNKYPNSHVSFDNFDGNTIKITVEDKVKIENLTKASKKILKNRDEILKNK